MNLSVFQQKQQILNKKREEELAEKNTRFFDHKSDLNKQHKFALKNINIISIYLGIEWKKSMKDSKKFKKI